MKRRLLIVLLSLVCAVCMAFGLSACDSCGSSADNSGNNQSVGQTDGEDAEQDGSSGKGQDGDDEGGSAENPDEDIDGDDEGEQGGGSSEDDSEQGGSSGNEQGGEETHTHIASAAVIENQKAATCTAEGSYESVVYCTICNAEISRETITVPKIDHTYGSNYTYDAAQHWQVCTVCGEADGKQNHTISGGVCSVCGYQEAAENEELAYTLSAGGDSYTVSGIGTVTSTTVSVPATYNGKPVTAISDGAFSGNIKIVIIIIGNNVTTIGENAFKGCTAITAVTMGSGVTSVGGSAFSGCTSLSNVSLGDNVKTIGNNAFYGCTSIAVIVIGNNVTSIGSGAFSGCTKLSSVTLGGSVQSIGASAFSGCSSLTSVSVPASVTSIGASAFADCVKIVVIVIYGNPEIADGAFSGCTLVTDLTLSDELLEDIYGLISKVFPDSSDLTEVKDTASATYHAHELAYTARVDATCKATGNIEYWYCSVCDKYFSDKYGSAEISADSITIAVAEHTKAAAVIENQKAATCTAEGSYESVIYCSVCGKEISRETVAVPKTDHTYDGGVITTAATCTETGVKTYTCTACGNTYTEEISAIGHNYVREETIPATYATTGLYTYTCSRCNDSYTEVIAVIDHTHNYESSITTAATCTETGVKTYTCLICGDTYTEVIPSAGHTNGEAVKENEKAATCTESGSYESVVYCTVCNAEISRETITTDSATGHNYSLTSWKWEDDYSAATALFTCANDSSHTLQQEAAITYLITTEATCGTAGKITYTAAVTVDGVEYTDEETAEIAATGNHTYSSDWNFDSTYHWQECTVCGYVGEKSEHTLNSDGDCTVCGVVKISTADQLTAISSDGSYILVNDIDLDGATWTPLSTFTGTLNGNGYVISNFTINSNSATYIGFINSNNGKIYNLGLENITISVSASSSEKVTKYVGGITGANSGTIYNCHTVGSISVTTTCTYNGYSAWSYAGGITGYNSGTVTNCYSSATVNAKCGGHGTAYAGGIIGYNNSSETISYCYSTGDITANTNASLKSTTSSTYAGGIVAYNNVSSVYISYCYSTGVITAYSYSTSYYAGTYSDAGGIVGFGSGVIANNCYATGNVASSAVFKNSTTTKNNSTCYAYGGGLIGYGGTIINCYATGDVTVLANGKVGGGCNPNCYAGGLAGYNATISNSYATGNVSGDCTAVCNANGTNYAYVYVGGLVAYTSGSITNCFATGNVTATASTSTSSTYKAQTYIYIDYLGYYGTYTNCYVCDEQVLTYSATGYYTNNYTKVTLTKYSVDTLLSKTFITETLGWSADDWVIAEGAYPVLNF